MVPLLAWLINSISTSAGVFLMPFWPMAIYGEKTKQKQTKKPTQNTTT